MHYNGWYWPMAAMMFGWLILILVVIAAVWLAANRGRRQSPDRHEHARRILGERYARGEMDTEEYHRRLDTLR
ncbi:MAG: SHOCT domain-containing protein [Micromonospora sp.]